MADTHTINGIFLQPRAAPRMIQATSRPLISTFSTASHKAMINACWNTLIMEHGKSHLNSNNETVS